MNTVTSATLGVLFLLLSFAATVLMFYLWGFPFDKATRKSEAPKWLMRTHRFIGYAYGLIYLVMMSQMVPRMWQYQVELPPRTVAHLLLGFLIGIILLVKLLILRFFRHLEEWMPYLGTALFACTVMLLGLSLPFAYRERVLAANTTGGDVFSSENRKRLAALLPQASFPAETPLNELTTVSSLNAGRTILLNKCVSCHDLKTVLAQPRTPSNWLATVTRMAEKPALSGPITKSEQWQVSAYLIAITPDLEKSMPAPQKQALPGTVKTVRLDPVLVTAGQSVYGKNGCKGCHQLNGQGGFSGPSLNGVGSRHADLKWQLEHLKSPSRVVPGSAMPAYDELSARDAQALSIFLLSLK